MANLLVTWRCNRHCSYCFARRQTDGQRPAPGVLREANDSISPARFEDVLQFCRRSNLAVVGILGGEPCLHPDLPGMIERLLGAGLTVRLFTGGLIPEETARFLARTDSEQVRIVVNVPGPADLGSPAAEEVFWNTMRIFAGRAALGYTIRAPEEGLGFLAELAKDYSMRSPLRLGLAAPCIDDNAPARLPPEVYPQVALRILEFAEACFRNQVEIEFDCGFPRCMFTAAEHERLRTRQVHTAFQCSPIVDIGPDLTAWSCFPLKALGEIQMDAGSTRDALMAAFGRQQRAYRNLGIYERCMTCPHKRTGACAGGCLAHVVRSFAP